MGSKINLKKIIGSSSRKTADDSLVEQGGLRSASSGEPKFFGKTFSSSGKTPSAEGPFSQTVSKKVSAEEKPAVKEKTRAVPDSFAAASAPDVEEEVHDKNAEVEQLRRDLEELHLKEEGLERELEALSSKAGTLTGRAAAQKPDEKSKAMKPAKAGIVGAFNHLGELKRIPSGIEGLDELIEGGLEKGSTILVTGGAGTVKTTFALQFLYFGAVRFHEPGLLITFEETRESLYKHHKEFGWDLEKLEKNGLLQILEFKPHQVNKLMEEGGGTIRDTVKSMNAARLAIDSITAYSILFKDEYQRRENILEFFELLKKWGCTSIIVSEMPPKLAEAKEGAEGFLTDAIISLQYSKREDKGVRVHSLEILKMRGTHHTNSVCALTFEKNGIVVYPEVEVF